MAKDYFLDHPTVDKVMRVVIALARETYVMKDRMALVETLLDKKGHVTRADIETHKPTDEQRAVSKADADRFIGEVMGPIVQDRVDLDP
jgi:hypothetical protein